MKAIIKKTFSHKHSKEIIDSCKENTMFSWSAQAKVNPIAMKNGEGCYFWDFDGKKYFDLNSQLMCSNIGHGNKYVIEAIKKQADELTYAGPGMATEIRAKAGKLIASKTPGDLKKIFFTLGGAEANENAIKFAKFYTKRNKIFARYRSYHGATQGAVSLTGDPRRWQNEPSMPSVLRTFDPYKYRSLFYREGMSDEEYSEVMMNIFEEQLMYENPESVAAIFLETVTGSNGLIIPPDGYMKRMRKICDKYGILMVCDEVMAGFGRTGKMFAIDHWDVVPDIITMAKGLTSAYLPLGACAVSQKIAKEFEERVFSGGLTYQAHPMSLACSVACLEYMDNEKIIENSYETGKIMKKLMEELKEKHPCLGDVRSIGLFGAFELVKNKKTKEPMAPYNGTSLPMQELSSFLKNNGVFNYVHYNLLHCSPPLIVKENQLKEVFAIIDKGLTLMDKHTV